MEKFGENVSDPGDGLGSVPEEMSQAEEIRIVLEYLVEAKKQLSSFLLGEIPDAGTRTAERKKGPTRKGPFDGNQDLPENKSISTGASMENVFLKNSSNTDNMFSQQTFKCEETNHFCKNVLWFHSGC